jgi:hypothetical protein
LVAACAEFWLFYFLPVHVYAEMRLVTGDAKSGRYRPVEMFVRGAEIFVAIVAELRNRFSEFPLFLEDPFSVAVAAIAYSLMLGVFALPNMQWRKMLRIQRLRVEGRTGVLKITAGGQQ